MKSKCYIYILVLLSYSLLLNAQSSKIWNGKIVSTFSELENISIINKKNNISTQTKEGGYFKILGSVGDTLQISAVQFEGIKFVLKQTDFEKELVLIELKSLITELEAIEIKKNKSINAVSLGILMKPATVYTVAERRMNAASGSPIETLYNFLSGENDRLKKNVETEKRIMAFEKIDYLFEEAYFVETLKIPQTNVKGFQYYCAEDAEFVKVLKTKNKTMTKFLLVDLARKYLILQNQK